MVISYKKLWKLLIDKDMKKKDLQALAGISSASVTKLGKNENVNTEMLGCLAVPVMTKSGKVWMKEPSPVPRKCWTTCNIEKEKLREAGIAK